MDKAKEKLQKKLTMFLKEISKKEVIEWESMEKSFEDLEQSWWYLWIKVKGIDDLIDCYVIWLSGHNFYGKAYYNPSVFPWFKVMELGLYLKSKGFIIYEKEN